MSQFGPTLPTDCVPRELPWVVFLNHRKEQVKAVELVSVVFGMAAEVLSVLVLNRRRRVPKAIEITLEILGLT